MKKILPSIIYILILSTVFKISFAKELTGPRGDVLQQNCINITESYPGELHVFTSATAKETGGQIKGSKNTTIDISPGRTGMFCSDKWDLNSIYDEGYVDFTFNVKNNTGTTLASFSSYSDFDGTGADNYWDINEKDQCAAQGGYGVYLKAYIADDKPLTFTCGLIEVDDEDGVSIIFVPELPITYCTPHNSYGTN